jgi:hypothetical protein
VGEALALSRTRWGGGEHDTRGSAGVVVDEVNAAGHDVQTGEEHAHVRVCRAPGQTAHYDYLCLLLAPCVTHTHQ